MHCALAFHFPRDEYYGAGIDTVCTYEPGISIRQRDISRYEDNNAIVKDGMNILRIQIQSWNRSIILLKEIKSDFVCGGRIKSFTIDKALSMSFT